MSRVKEDNETIAKMLKTIEREGGVMAYIKQERLEEVVKSFRTRRPRRRERTEEAAREGEGVGLDWCLGFIACGVA
jgi:hypothetical protein